MSAPAFVDEPTELETAFEHGTTHEFALALRDWMRAGIMQHSATDGHPVSFDTATAIAGNLAGGLAFMLRGGM